MGGVGGGGGGGGGGVAGVHGDASHQNIPPSPLGNTRTLMRRRNSLDESSAGIAASYYEENPEWRDEVIEFEELLEWFSSAISLTVSRARTLIKTLHSERDRINYKLATSRNRILELQIIIMILSLGMTACSVISGFFGMNLSNGTCGPEGCNGTCGPPDAFGNLDTNCFPPGKHDSGHSVFLMITGFSVGLAAIVCYAMVKYAHQFVRI